MKQHTRRNWWAIVALIAGLVEIVAGAPLLGAVTAILGLIYLRFGDPTGGITIDFKFIARLDHLLIAAALVIVAVLYALMVLR